MPRGTAPEPEPATRRDPDVVDWEGPDDPENPLNWPLSSKAVTVAIISAITFVNSLASSIFAPGIPHVMTDFNSSSQELASLAVSVYIAGFCFGPLVIAPLSEFYGRAPLYHVCLALFVILSVSCAVAPSLGALVVIRLLSGVAGSCPMALGPGSIADLVPREKRGTFMAAWIVGPVFGPIIGPIAGGYLTQAKGWRWPFWVLAIAGAVVSIMSFFFLRETYPCAILNQKTKRLRRTTGNGGLRSTLEIGRDTRRLFSVAIIRPSKMLIFSPIVSLLSLYLFILNGYLYLFFTALPGVLEREYGFSSGQVGLSYLGNGTGSILGLLVSGVALDWLAESLLERNGGVYRPEYRLPLMILAGIAVPVGLLWFGWTANFKQHWILPIVGTSFLGFGIMLAYMAISTYLVDAFGAFAASAVAASTVLRSLGGATLPLAGGKMFDTLGIGWGSSLLAFVALAMVPVPAVLYRYGERIRNRNLCGIRF